ncbi:MAG TPA: molybdate ABC transporter substrate-binding protein [Solirubrobacteraceae bacterium]|nr:molybdate ABC transporter substrate-binding protein [Solirubrobacteraceae bacterium]
MKWVVLALLAALAGCGGDDQDGGSGSGRLVVSAAASLTDALTECSADNVKLSFGGSDELAAQIRQGVKPDVYAAANTTLPDQLNREGLVERPVVFATNELVIAVPDDSGVDAIDDLAGRGVKLAVGAETVPVGSYTRTVLAKLPADEEEQILANVRSEEPDVKGVVGKLTQGAADAGFVYRTDVVDGLKAVTLPEDLQPVVEYGAAVVKPSGGAQSYLDGLTDGPCADALRKAGFGAP